MPAITEDVRRELVLAGTTSVTSASNNLTIDGDGTPPIFTLA